MGIFPVLKSVIDIDNKHELDSVLIVTAYTAENDSIYNLQTEMKGGVSFEFNEAYYGNIFAGEADFATIYYPILEVNGKRYRGFANALPDIGHAIILGNDTLANVETDSRLFMHTTLVANDKSYFTGKIIIGV